MPSHSQPSPDEDDDLEAAVDQAIAACDGNKRSAIRALIVANNYLESEVAGLMKRFARLCAWTVSPLFRLRDRPLCPASFDRRLPPAHFAIGRTYYIRPCG